jgi:hypothetical protein
MGWHPLMKTKFDHHAFVFSITNKSKHPSKHRGGAHEVMTLRNSILCIGLDIMLMENCII